MQVCRIIEIKRKKVLLCGFVSLFLIREITNILSWIHVVKCNSWNARLSHITNILLSNRLEDLKDSYEEKLESKFEMYKEAIKKHAYMCAMEQIEDHYVPIEEFLAEQEKVEVWLWLPLKYVLAS